MANQEKKNVTKLSKKLPNRAVKKTTSNGSKKEVKKEAPKKKAAGRSLRAAPPAAEKTTLDTLYIVNDSNKQVTLEVNVGGENQTSDMTIMLNDTTVVENLAGDFTETVLGTNTELNGQKLSIVANIADTSRQTNLTSLTIRLKGGVSANEFPLSKTVDEEGDSEDYMCLIEFFNPLS